MKKNYMYFTLVTLLALAQLQGFTQDWNIQTVGNNYSDKQLMRLDNNGTPHCLVLNHYYSWDGLGWNYIDVPYLTGSYSRTFCLNDNGVAHYLFRVGSTMMHEYLDNNIWYRDTIRISSYLKATAIFYGTNSDSNHPDILIFDSHYSHYYIYKYDTSTNLYVNNLTIALNGNITGYYPYTDYCTDDDGNLYFVYRESSYDIIFNFYDGTTWSSFSVTDGTSIYLYPRITLDQNDIPHVSYYDMNSKDLIHAKLPAQTMMMLKEGKITSKVPSQTITQ